MAFDDIGKALDILKDDGGSEIAPVSGDVQVPRQREEKPDLKRDYEYTRGQLYSLIEKVKRLLMGSWRSHKNKALRELMKLLGN